MTVAPNDPLLRKVKLNCRQCRMAPIQGRGTHVLEIKGVWVNKREAQYDYNDVYRTKLHEGSTVHQHHQLRKRIREITKLDWGELSIALPKQVKIEPQVYLSLKDVQAHGKEFTGILTQPVTATSYMAATPASAYPNAITPGMYKQMTVRIEYFLQRPTAGVRFVGCEPGDNVHLPIRPRVSDNSDIRTFILQMIRFLDQRVHGYLALTGYGKDVPGRSTSLSRSE